MATEQPFMWGMGGKKLTQEQIDAKREIARALMKQGMDYSPVGHWAQGLSRVAQGVMGAIDERQAGVAEDELLSHNSDIIKGLLGGASPVVAAETSAIPMTEAAGELAATAPASSTVDISGDKQAFIQALLPAAIEESKRTGVDPRIIVAQAAQETGWGKSAPGNNFFGIKSHGQDGGNSLMTTEYVDGKPVSVRDSFRAYGSPAESVRGYGDFILQNPRYEPLRTAQGIDAQLEALQASGYATDPNYSRSVGAIARSIQLPSEVAAVTPEAAIEAVSPVGGSLTDEVAEFEQTPAYASQFPGMAAQTGQTQEVAQTPAVAQALAGGQQTQQQASGINPAILQALADPRATPQTRAVAQALMQQQMQQNDPLRQLQIQQAQVELERARNPQVKVPDSVRALQMRAEQAGLLPGTPEYQKFMLSGGDKGITINNEGNIPAGYQAVRDAQGRIASIEPIPGSPAALEMEQALKSRETQGGRRETATDVITTAASEARNLIKNGTLATGSLGRLASNLTESDAAELRRQIDVLKSNATIENLTAMRQASPTGGALGSVTEKEGAMLAAASGAIDPDAGKEQVEKALDNYERTLLRVIHGPKVGDAIFEQSRQKQPAVINGYQIEEVTE